MLEKSRLFIIQIFQDLESNLLRWESFNSAELINQVVLFTKILVLILLAQVAVLFQVLFDWRENRFIFPNKLELYDLVAGIFRINALLNFDHAIINFEFFLFFLHNNDGNLKDKDSHSFLALFELEISSELLTDLLGTGKSKSYIVILSFDDSNTILEF